MGKAGKKEKLLIYNEKKEFRVVSLNPAGSERPFNRHSISFFLSFFRGHTKMLTLNVNLFVTVLFDLSQTFPCELCTFCPL